MTIGVVVLVVLLQLLCLTFLVIIWLRSRKQPHAIGFLHPNCCDFGGGERVLWSLVAALLQGGQESGVKEVVIYAARDTFHDSIEADLQKRFGLSLPSKEKRSAQLLFVKLKSAWLLNPQNYPAFTLLLQAGASILVTLEALLRLSPGFLIDTSGLPFGTAFAKLLVGSKTACYIHYPFISTDMIESVATQNVAFNNTDTIARSEALTSLKLRYYKILAALYGCCGGAFDRVAVNSSWTHRHIARLMTDASDLDLEEVLPLGSLLKRRLKLSPERLSLVHPPCNPLISTTTTPSDSESGRRNEIISLAQFRPEKNHSLQIRAMARLKELAEKREVDLKAKLHVCGSVRNDDDLRVVQAIEKEAAELKLLKDDKETYNISVEIHINIDIDHIKNLFNTCSIGLHTMKNEHFGICLVEFMAAGLLTVAHNSGGPKLDILLSRETPTQGGMEGPFIETPYGFLCSSDEKSFAEALFFCLTTPSAELDAIRERARERAQTHFPSSEDFGPKCLEKLGVFYLNP